MIIRDINFELKDGRKAVIRSPKDEDIEGMLHYLYVSSGETEFIVRYPEECGNCAISIPTSIKKKHRASVSIALLSEYWNQGIGTRMFQEMIRIAESFEDVIQIELDFVEGNTRARHLYEKMGFRITGVRPNAIRLKNGSLLNEYMMVREIKR